MLRVTQILKTCGLIDDEWSSEEAMLRGTYVHEACALDNAGRLNDETLDPIIAPYVQSYRVWLVEMEPELLATEEEVRYEAMGYLGHLDLRIRLRGRHIVVDLKTGGPAPWHRFQLALYALAWAAQNPEQPLPGRAALYLSKDGARPTFVEFTDRKDFDRAKALVTVAYIKQEAAA